MNKSLHTSDILVATVWSGRGDHDKAYQLLEKAKELHAGYLHSKQPAPKAYDEIFMDEVPLFRRINLINFFSIVA